MLPPAEIAAAAVEIVRVNFGATREQVIQAVARAFGVKATSGVMRQTIGTEIDGLVERNALAVQAGVIVMGQRDETTRG